MRRVARPLLYAGVVAVVLGLAKVHASAIGHYDWTGSARATWTVAYILVLAVAAYGAGLPDLPRSWRAAVGPAVGAAAGGAAVVSAVQLAVGDELLPRFVVFGSALLLSGWYLLCAALARDIRVRAEDRDRVLIVASSPETAALRAELDQAPERPAVVVGSLLLDEAVSRRPRSRPLLERVIAERASVVVLDRDAAAEPSVVSQAATLHESGFRIRMLSQFYEEWLGKLPISELERAALFFDIGEIHRIRYGRVKRLLDIAVGSAGIVALALAVPVVVAANRLANRGPLLFRQPRIGKHDRTFEILKFRTMRPSAPGVLANEWTGENDPRITPFGRVMRLTHLDELPQAVNILRGDLAVVGPRPEQPHYVEELTQKLPFYGMRHLVRPGVTGWAQVKYGYAGSEQDALEKLQYEFFYLRWQGLVFDIRIIGRTVRSVVRREGT